MKISNLTGRIALIALLLWGCNDDLDVKGPISNEKSVGHLLVATDVIDFEGLAAGTIVTQVWTNGGLGPIDVWGHNPSNPALNAAMIFDSSNPTGDDPDLGTPNADFGGPGIGIGGKSGKPYQNDTPLNNLLIITEDWDSSDPDDANLVGAKFTFDFSALGSVSVFSMNVVDIDANEIPGKASFYDAFDVLIAEYPFPITGDNGVALVEFGSGVAGVVKMVVRLNGSGAIDNIAIAREEGDGCTLTQGYWKTHSKYGPASKPDATWNLIGEDTPFFLSGATYYQVINTPPTGGNAYYILAHQYIAAKLNKLNGAGSTPEVNTALNSAKALFETYTPAQIKALNGSDPLRKQFIDLAKILDDYNNGLIGPGHCE